MTPEMPFKNALFCEQKLAVKQLHFLHMHLHQRFSDLFPRDSSSDKTTTTQPFRFTWKSSQTPSEVPNRLGMKNKPWSLPIILSFIQLICTRGRTRQGSTEDLGRPQQKLQYTNWWFLSWLEGTLAKFPK